MAFAPHQSGETAGQPGEGVGHAQAHGDGEGGIDGGSPYHVHVVAGGADGEAQPGSQEQDQQDAHEDCDESGKQSFVPGSADACVFEEGEDGFGFQKAYVGAPAHDHKVHGVEAHVGDDAGQYGGNAELCLKKCGYKACGHACNHGGGNGKQGMPGGGQGHGYGGAQDKAAVCGQIRNIQNTVA